MTSRVQSVQDLSLSAYGIARSTVAGSPLSPEDLRKTNEIWRACNYLSLGMIYLQANPLLREPLLPEHVKNRLLGHWGSSPGRAWSRVFGGHLFRDLSRQVGRRTGIAGILQTVLVPRRH